MSIGALSSQQLDRANLDIFKDSTNLSSLFAKFILELAQKEGAEGEKILEQLKKERSDVQKTKEMRDICEEAIALIEKGQANGFTERSWCRDFRKEVGITYKKDSPDNNNPTFSKSDWQDNIKSLDNFLSTHGTKINELATELEEKLGKYNAFLSGVAKTMSDGFQLMQGLSNRLS